MAPQVTRDSGITMEARTLQRGSTPIDMEVFNKIALALEKIRPHLDENGQGLIDKIVAIVRNPSSHTPDNIREVIKDGTLVIVAAVQIDKFVHVVGPDIMMLFAKLAELVQWLTQFD